MQQRKWWEEHPPVEAAAPVAPASPGIPLTGPDPRRAPETARISNQAAASAYDPARAATDLEAARIKLEQDRIKLEEDRRRFEAGPAASATESTGQAAGFYQRALKAHQGYGEGVPPRGWLAQEAADIAPAGLVNSLTGEPRQHAETYAREFVAATLRRESGAAISPAEYSSQYARYFPIPGDTPETIAIKRRLRENAIDALRTQAGQLAGPDPQQPPADQGAPQGSPPSLFQPQGGPQRPDTGVGNVRGMDSTRVRTYDPSQDPQGIELNQGDPFRLEEDPALSAVKARVNQMFKQRKSAREVALFLKNAGVPLDAARMQSLIAVEQWNKQNPGYRGNYGVESLDDVWKPVGMLDRARATVSASGPGQMGGHYIDDVTGGRLDNITNLMGGNGERVNLALEQGRRDHPYWSIAGDVAAGASLYGAGRKLAAAGAGRIPLPAWLTAAPGGATLAPQAIAGDAALGAYVGSGQNGTDVFDPASSAKGAMWSVAGGIGGRGAFNTAARAVAPTGGRLAPLYAEGVQPTLGQRMGGAASRFEEAHTAIPLLGGIPRNARNLAIDQAQRGAFNQALREIGDELPKNVVKGPQAHAYMQRAFNQVYDRARAGMQFRPDGGFAQEFGAVQQQVSLLSRDSQQTFAKMIEPIGIRLRGRGGVLNGNDYKTMVSRIDAKVRALRKNPTGDGELADALEGFSVAMDDAARRSSSPQAAALLDAADRGYVKSVIIENAARGAGAAGEFSGKALETAIKNGAGGLRARVFLRGDAPMQDYAAGMRQLGDTVGDSGTIPRLAATGGTGVIAATHPYAMIPSAASLATNLPGVRQGINLALRPRGGARAAALRDQIQQRARLMGTLFSVPLLESEFGP